MAGMTNTGLTILRQNDVIDGLKREARTIFQDLVPPNDVVDTSSDSTIGRMIGLYSLPLADLWEAVQEVYLAFDPNSATGVALENLVQYAGLTRHPATPTTATGVVWGDVGTDIIAFANVVRATDNTLYDVVSSASLLPTKNIGVKIKLDQDVTNGETYSISITLSNTTINISSVADGNSTKASIISDLESQINLPSTLKVKATEDTITIEMIDIFAYMQVGVSNLVVEKVKSRVELRNQGIGVKDQPANSINQIATPVIGWDSINNPQPAISGVEAETDNELRLRFRESKFLRAQNISDALYSALLELDGVEYVNVYENETGVYDATFDLPGHSFKAIVLGGTPSEIASVIWRNKPLGIGAEGNTQEIIFDSQGFSHTMKFSRPNSVQIFIDLEITPINGFPASGVSDIKSALIEYFRNNFTIGSEVIYSRLYTPINSVKGHQVENLTIGLTDNPVGVSNIPMSYDEIAVLNSEDINITVN